MVSETYPPEINGVALTIGYMVHGLRQRQHQIHLIRPRQHAQDRAIRGSGYEETLVPGVPIPGYPELKSGLPAKGRLLRLWREQRPDVVHIATEGLLGWSACSAARKLGIPVNTDFHTNFHNYSEHYGVGWLNKPISAYLRHFHNRAHCTLVPTNTLRQELAQAGYKNVFVVARGVDAELFHPERRSEELRRQWGAADNTPVAIFVSRIAPEKNLPVVIRVFDRIRASKPEVRLVMVGDGPARAELEKQHPHIIFAGMRTGEDLATHFASGDVFLFPSLTETYGNVTMEAMASGLAVVAYDYAAAKQHIRHGVNGLLAPFGDADSFVGQAAALIADPVRIQRLRTQARHTVAMLAWEHIIGQLEDVLVKLVKSQGAGRAQTCLTSATD